MFLQLDFSPPVINQTDWTRFRMKHSSIEGPTGQWRDQIELKSKFNGRYENISAAVNIPKTNEPLGLDIFLRHNQEPNGHPGGAQWKQTRRLTLALGFHRGWAPSSGCGPWWEENQQHQQEQLLSLSISGFRPTCSHFCKTPKRVFMCIFTSNHGKLWKEEQLPPFSVTSSVWLSHYGRIF